ncbi:hypothetical protein BAY06_00055 [Elizabethkingia anophelis]|nr:hypothetical protein [Elizabethkingia anophelis]OPC55322.1 hypothetical protein BAY06_00055 [Elizabethkingia anophelis]
MKQVVFPPQQVLHLVQGYPSPVKGGRQSGGIQPLPLTPLPKRCLNSSLDNIEALSIICLESFNFFIIIYFDDDLSNIIKNFVLDNIFYYFLNFA